MDYEVMKHATQSMGQMSVSGRYHQLPQQLSDQYTIGKQALGTGYSGAVLLAHSKQTGAKYAVKAFKLHGIDMEKKKELVSEVQIFLMMDHPHVARLVDVYEGANELSLVMECIEGGELFDKIAECKVFREKDAVEATHQMLLAINYLHSLNIVHRDLKLENFLYEKQGSDFLKLIDFGFSKIWDKNTKMELSCGTLSYVAPEVLAKNYTSKCDMWSLGVIVFILLVGHMPFAGASERQQIVNIRAGKFAVRKERWAKVSGEAYEFMSNLLVVNPEARMAANSALDHPWMRRRRQSQVVSQKSIHDDLADDLVSFARESQFRRKVMQLMSWSLTHEERSEVRQAFLEIDKNKEGTINLSEMRDVLQGRFSLPDVQIKEVFQALDSNSDGSINYSEFLAAMMSTRLRMHDSLLWETFRRFDKDSSGTIDIANFKTVLGEDQDIEKIMTEVDLNKDGKISYEEFIAFLHKVSDDEGADLGSVHEGAARVIDRQIRSRTNGSLEYPEVPVTPGRERKRDKLRKFAMKFLGSFGTQGTVGATKTI